jgi:alkanesulfonate monooxygenase SsuD/methylene tetrahydromethanopterin reductase-like flavin-dependent oxidoreductase (luciferase family)
MQISISIEAMLGLNWPLWKDIIQRVDHMGFHALYRSDHFMIGKTGADSLELVTSLTYLAQHSQRLHFGSMVAPLSFRHPVMLARQAMAMNDLSEGRMILGLGAGWHDEEHSMFGYELGDTKTRMDRFEEGVQVIDALVRRSEPVDYDGKYFQLRQAQLLPQSPVRILIGGNGPTRTLPLVARYADVWNCQLVRPADFRTVNARLDELIQAAGRAHDDVKRTMLVPVLVTHAQQDLERHLHLIQQYAPPFYHASGEEIQAALFGANGIIGSPAQVQDELAAYAANGVEEVILEWFGLYDLEGMEALGELVRNG